MLSLRRRRDDRGWDGWHHWVSGYEFEQALADGEGQGILTFCNPWAHKQLDTTERLKNNMLSWLPRWQSGKQSACNADWPGLDPWVREVHLEERAWQLTTVFLPGEELGRLQSISLQRVGHDWSNLECTKGTLRKRLGTGYEISFEFSFKHWGPPYKCSSRNVI